MPHEKSQMWPTKNKALSFSQMGFWFHSWKQHIGLVPIDTFDLRLTKNVAVKKLWEAQ